MICLLASPALPATLLVRPDGAGDFPNIQAAVDAAHDGDLIELLPGMYVGDGNRDVYYSGKAITIRSRGRSPSDCIIDCQASDTDRHIAFFFLEGEGPGSVLDGVTITRANGGWAGAIMCDDTSPTITNCVFRDNHTGEGAGIYCETRSSATITHCVFTENTARTGAGIHVTRHSRPLISKCAFINNSAEFGGAIYSGIGAEPVIEHCTIKWNTAQESGAGIYCEFASSPLVSHTTFYENSAPEGAAVYCQDSSSPTLNHCALSRNTAETRGGAISCLNSSPPTLLDCVLAMNSADLGGAISCADSSSPTLTDCRFEENSATRGAGLQADETCRPVLTACTFRGNAAEERGGGVNCRSASIVECVFDGNTAIWGGGLHCFSSTISHCTFAHNVAERYGGGLYSTSHSPTVTQCTFVENSAHDGAAIASFHGSSPTITQSLIVFSTHGEAVYGGFGAFPILSCSDLHGNQGGDWIGRVADQLGTNGNFSSDPLFCNIIGGNYTLLLASPCLPGNHPNGVSCGTIGAWGKGCITVPIVPTSWGQVKARFLN